MSKLLYAEPDDEITNLVDRLRSEKEEKELVFVLPPSSRVLHSSLNARLLMQYSNSLGKQTRVVSADSRTQQVAIDSGFAVFPSVDAFQAGGALDHAASAAGGMMAPVSDAAATIHPAERPPRRTTATPATAAARPPRTPRTAESVSTGVGGVPYLLAAIGFLVVVLALAYVLLPSATITIVTAARPISANVTVTGAAAPPATPDPLFVQTTLLTAEEHNQQQFPATGTKTIPAVAATGQVTFCYCHQINPIYPTISIPKGSEVSTDTGIKFLTTSDINSLAVGQSATVGISAEAGGVSGNVPPNTIKNLTNNPDPNKVTVKNDQPTSGGVDAVNQQVVSQADLDKAAAALGGPLVQKVKDDLTQKAGNLKQVAETLVTPTNATYDHKANDAAANFTATVSVPGKVTAVEDGKVRAAIANALTKQVSADFTLTADKPTIDYKVASHDDNGGVVFDGNVAGFEATRIDIEGLKKAVSGKTPAQARSTIASRVDASDVIIRISPPFMPGLPYLTGHIDLRETVERPK